MATRAMRDEQFVELLRQMGEDDPGVTIYEFCRAVGCSLSVVYRRFGSWPDLRERAGLERVGRRGMPRMYSADEIREAFRKAVERFGPGVTRDQFSKHSGICHTTIKRHVGGWEELRAGEGLEPNRTRRRPRIGREEILKAFRKAVAEHGDELTLATFREHSGIGESTVQRRFGGWNELRALEGLGPNRVGPRVSSEEIEEAFRAAVAEHGKALTQGRFTQLTGFGHQTIWRRCGGWRKLREAHGVPEDKPALPVISDEKIVAEYKRIKKILRRPPTYRELGNYSYYGEETFRKRFHLFRWRASIRRVMAKKIAERKEDLAGEASTTTDAGNRGGEPRPDSGTEHTATRERVCWADSVDPFRGRHRGTP